MGKGTKNINIEVSLATWKKLKMLSIHQDKTLQDIVGDILEKSVNNKKVESLLGVEEVEK